MLAVKSALRTLQILETFADAQRPLSLAELARVMQTPKSSCLALLSTLTERGYLYRVGPAPSAYYPTRRWLGHATRVAERDPIATQVRATLTRLRDATGETAIDAVLVGEQSVYLDVVESHELLRYTARVGDTKPLHASASGRAQLGALDSRARKALVDRVVLDTLTPNTRTGRRTFERTVEQERATGWSVNLGEYRADVMSVASGVDLHGTVHALAIAAPLQRAQAKADQFGALLRREADALAALLR